MSKELEADAVEALASVIADLRTESAKRPLLLDEVKKLSESVRAYRLLVPAPKGEAVAPTEPLQLIDAVMQSLEVPAQVMPSLPPGLAARVAARPERPERGGDE